MALTLVTIPCLEDNYAFVVHNPETGETALVDVPDAAPINAVLQNKGWRLTDVILTHHHWDHIDGLPDLETDARIIGAAADEGRLPSLNLAVSEGDTFTLCGEQAQIIDVSGHTNNHIAIYLPESGIAFTADSLMAMGCGRLFEGTPAQMWDSLQKLRALPPETVICSGHEYTESNARFAATLEADNARLNSRILAIKTARSAGRPTVPSLLSEEIATNPFLRADDPIMKKALNMTTDTDLATFTEIRSRKDHF